MGSADLRSPDSFSPGHAPTRHQSSVPSSRWSRHGEASEVTGRHRARWQVGQRRSRVRPPGDDRPTGELFLLPAGSRVPAGPAIGSKNANPARRGRARSLSFMFRSGRQSWPQRAGGQSNQRQGATQCQCQCGVNVGALINRNRIAYASRSVCVAGQLVRRLTSARN